MGLARACTEAITARRPGWWVPVVLGLAVGVGCGSQAASASGTGHAVSARTPAAQTAATGSAATPSADWPTFDVNAARTGVGPASGITAGNAGRLALRTVTVDGVVDASAVQLSGVTVAGRSRDVIFVTTTYGNTIAIDPATGARLWEFRPSGVNARPGNPQVTNATPVIDPGRRSLYTASPNGVIHKLSAATGHQLWARSVTFDPGHEKLASALNISGPWVVATTGGYYGDPPPYDGHVVLIDRATGRIAHLWNSECSSRHYLIRASSCPTTAHAGDNAIWGRSGAVIEPGSGRILVTTGNGPFDGHSAWGDSTLELSPDARALLHNWTPTNQLFLASTDSDLGSTSPAVLPAYHGYALAVQGGKSGKLALLNLRRLDGTTGPAGPRLGGALQTIPAPGGDLVYTAPAVWQTRGRIIVFVGTDSGTGAYELTGGGHPRLRSIWHNGSGATSPVISGGLLYTYDNGGQVQIRNPLTGALVRSLAASAGHWNSPIVLGGRIIEPTGTFHGSAASSTIDIWHLPGR